MLLTTLAGCRKSPQYTVNIAVQGAGSVSPATGGRYSRGSVVGLTPTAAAGWTFAGWSGPDGGAVVYDARVRRYKLYVDGNKNITAIFVHFTTVISPADAGEVEVAWISGPTDSGSSVVRLTARETEGSRYVFDHWSGDLTGTDNPIEVVADRPLTIQANFQELPFKVDVTVKGQGKVTKDSTVAPIIGLTPTPARDGWAFHHWEGDLTGTANPGQVVVDRDLSVTAFFYPKSLLVAPGWYHTLALVPEDGVWAWGDNRSGQLGDGSTVNSLVPVDTAGLPANVEAIASGGTGDGHSVALAGGVVYTWGYNSRGQLGDNATSARSTPAAVAGLSGVSRISAGGEHTVALAGSGVYAWGSNQFGQIGDGTITDRLAPVGVSVPETVRAIAAGGYFTLALTDSNNVYAWGYNRYGTQGNGTTNDQHLPQHITALSNVAGIFAGRNHVLALTYSGQVYAWGRNDLGQLGVNSPSSNPPATDWQTGVPVSYRSTPTEVVFPGPVTTVTSLAAGQEHSLALTNDGVYSWGGNSQGQLGDGTAGFRYQPQKVSGLPGNIAGIAAGRFSSFAWTADGRLYAWGDNTAGQLGDGSSANVRTAPVLVQWPAPPLL